MMKSPEVQFKCPCMTTTDVNLMKCDGPSSLQERVFEAMTYLEHPDDIYEIYIKPLNEARRQRDELRRLAVSAGLHTCFLINYIIKGFIMRPYL